MWAMVYKAAMEDLYYPFGGGAWNGRSFGLPLLIKDGATGMYVSVTESNFSDEWTGAKVIATTNALSIGKTIDTNITVSSGFTSAWKIFAVGTLEEIGTSSLVTDTADAADGSIDYSSVEPGFAAWSWLDGGYNGQTSLEKHKEYIDLAAEMGWTYYNLDYGWQIPDLSKGEDKDAFGGVGTYEVIPGVYRDWMEELVEYANKKNIKLIGWVHKDNLMDETKMNAVLESYAEIGLSGIKADFFDSESVETMQTYKRLYQKCAELGLVVNVHGANKPSGEMRTYPNVIAREAVRGEEYSGYDTGMTVEQLTIAAFTRALAGPVDLTESILPRGNNKTTAASQVAISTLFTSGIHYITTTPEQIRASKVYDLYKELPVAWDESKVLDAEIREYTYMARRSGEKWYVAGISVDARTASVSLDFLSKGCNYYAQIYKDGADKMSMATESVLVNHEDTLNIETLANGGFTVVLTKTEEVSVTFDGKNEVKSETGATITLPEGTASGNYDFVGWEYNGDVYAANKSFVIPINVKEVKFTGVYTNSDNVVVYLDVDNGDDANSGLAVNDAVKTLERAVEVLSTLSSEQRMIKLSGKLEVAKNMPEADFMVIIDGGATAEFAINTEGTWLKSPLTLQNIQLTCATADKFLNTSGYELVLGDGVVTALSSQKIKIHSGTMNSSGGKESVTVNSGTVRILAGAYYNNSQTNTTAGAEYTINGGEVNLQFVSDGWSDDQHGTNFTEPVNILHNGGQLEVSVSTSTTRPIAFEDAVTVIDNNGTLSTLGNLADYATKGFYHVTSGLGGICDVTDTVGQISVTPDEGLIGYAGNAKITENVLTLSADTTSIRYLPDCAAVIGDTQYDSIADALNAAKAGDVIMVIGNSDSTETLTVTKGELNFNGFTVSNPLILTGGSVVADYELTNVSVQDGILLSKNDEDKYYYCYDATTIDGTTIHLGNGKYTISAGEGENELVFTKNGYTFNVSGETALTVYGGKDAALTVESGTIGTLYVGTAGDVKLTVNGGTVNQLYTGTGDAVTTAVVKVNGGVVETLYVQDVNDNVIINVGNATITSIVKGDESPVTINGTNGKIFIGWDEQNKAAFANVSIHGTSLRYNEKLDLRFMARIDGDYQNTLVSYGLLTLPRKSLKGELTVDTQGVNRLDSTDDNFKVYKKTKDSLYYTMMLENIEPAEYDQDIVVRAYVKYTINGEEYIAYSDQVTDNAISVVTRAYNASPEKTKELYDNIYNEYSATFMSVGEFSSLVNQLSEESYKSFTLDFSMDTVPGADGTETTIDGWKSTDYLEVGDFEIVQYALSRHGDVSSLAFYNQNKEYIKGYSKSANNEAYMVWVYQQNIPSDAVYVRFSCHDDFVYSRASLANDIGKRINEYAVSKDATSLADKKIVCVGDSLTYGDYGTPGPVAGYPQYENYPYYLKKYTGANVEWYARGGYTAAQLAACYKDGIFSGEGRPGMTFNIKDADYVIIMLGTNKGLTLNGDKTNYNAYHSLLSEMKSDMKEGAKIILCTPPHATTDTSKVNYGYMPNVVNAYPEVYNLAKEFDLAVLDVYRDSGFDASNEDLLQPNDGLHFGGVGYSALAAFMANGLRLVENDRLDAMGISDIIREEDEAFLATIDYPSYVLASGKYSTLGRWFKKNIDGVSHDVTTTAGSELYFMTQDATSFTVDFNVITTKDTPYYAVSIDGNDFVRYPITQETIALPDNSRHAVRLVMDGIHEGEDKWNGEIGFAIKDITVDTGFIKAIKPTNDVVFYYGDSITEGVASLNLAAVSSSDNNSAVGSYAHYSAKQLDSIPYYIGYGGSGYTSNGSFQKALSAIDYLSKERLADSNVVPDKIVINHGYNDDYKNMITANSVSSKQFSDAMREVLRRLQEKYPNVPIYYVQPYHWAAEGFATEIRTVCAEFDGVAVIETADYGLEYTKDKIHVTKESAQKAGVLIAKEIKNTDNRTHEYDNYISYRKPLQNAVTKLKEDNSIKIAYFGGSVTAGYGASDFGATAATNQKDTKAWRAQTTQWFKDNYPTANIETVYAAIGESGTHLGAYIVQDYVIAEKPDVVFLEYAINDYYHENNKERAARQCETIVREIKEALPQCDIVMLISIDINTRDYNKFLTAQGHAAIAEHYNIPIIFMGRALSDYIAENSLNWYDYFLDGVHPKDAGYAYYFQLVKEYLHNSLFCTIHGDGYLPADTMPEMYSEYLFDGNRTMVFTDDEALRQQNPGWTYYSNININPVFSKHGSIGADLKDAPVFTYTFTGTQFAIYASQTLAGKTYTYSIDDGAMTGSGTFTQHNPTSVVEGLESGVHTVTITPTATETSEMMYIDAVFYRDAAQQTTPAVLQGDTEFLATIDYPSYSLASGKYTTLGRWFEKEIDGVSHNVTVTAGSELYFMTRNAGTFTVDFTVITEKATPYYAVSIDGGDPERHLITDNTITLPEGSRHVIRLIMDGLTESENKWEGEIGFAIKNITVDTGCMKAIKPTNDIIFYYGDSITEGINAFGESGNSNSSSATNSYSYYSATALNAIPYFIGYGGTGVLATGSFNTFNNSIDYLSATRLDKDKTVPDKIVVNYGANDFDLLGSSEEFSVELRKALTRLCEKYPNVPIYYVIPFSQKRANEIRTVVKEFATIKLIESIDFNLTYTDRVHPDVKGAEKAGQLIAAQIAE